MEKQFYTSAFVQEKYRKALTRFERNVQSGRFAAFAQHKKRQIWHRLCRYARQLGVALCPTLTAACLAAGLSLATPVSAQIFTAQTGAANPFNGVDVGNGATPTFVDIDGDGDRDAFIGNDNGLIKYYRNTGTATAPVFVEQTGAANPLDNTNVGLNAAPSFVDIDGDGDQDVFVGDYYEAIPYYKNLGTATAPNFAEQTINPFIGLNVGSIATPTFVDIDNDGDQDVFIGNRTGTIQYYRNTGTTTAPVFTGQTGAANPFNGVDVGGYAAPTFVDIDNDGDQDAFIGNGIGIIKYYRNTGTTTAPMFTEQTGAANPFNGVDVGNGATPTFVDVDNDGDRDAFIGNRTGTLVYYRNTSPVLPVELLAFTGTPSLSGNLLTWQTANEHNNKGFEIERLNGSTWQNIGFVAANNKPSTYYFTDKDPLNISYYRLRQIDYDGKETLSKVISIATDSKNKLIIYPNPVANFLTLENIEGGDFEILNLLGQTVMRGKATVVVGLGAVLDVSALPKGSYVLKVGTKQVQFMKQE